MHAPNGDYGGGGTALGLVATSIHPEEAGVQFALMDLLASAGADLEGQPDGWRPIDAPGTLSRALRMANGWDHPDTVQMLIGRGAAPINR